ncbi:MAG: Rieske (2Fe-2S) protein, partial [Phycisphaerae bacterium]
WIRLLPVDEAPPDSARFIHVGDSDLAVFHLSDPDRFVIIDNGCPHAGGNLSAGEIACGVVTCPWHHWQFDLDSGTCPDAPRVRLRTHSCRVADGYVYVRLNDTSPTNGGQCPPY